MGGGQWRQLWEARYWLLCMSTAALIMAYAGVLLLRSLLGWAVRGTADTDTVVLWTGVVLLIGYLYYSGMRWLYPSADSGAHGPFS